MQILGWERNVEGKYEEKIFEVDDSFAQIVSQIFVQEKSARTERESKWREYLQAYALKPTLPEPKLPWQSRNISAKFFYLIEQFASIIRRSLMNAPKFFSISSSQKEFSDLALVLENLARYYLEAYSFLSEFEKAIKIGAITGEILLEVDWKYDIEEIAGRKLITSKPVITAHNPLDVVLDPAGLQRFYIKRYYMRNDDILKKFSLGVWREVPLEIPKIDDLDEQAKKIYFDFSEYARKEGISEVIEFFGNLYHKGQIYKNLHLVVLNREYVVKAEIIDYWHRKLPLVHTHLYQVPGGSYGLALFDPIYSSLVARNLLQRAIEDSVFLSTGVIVEIDKTRISEEQRKKIRNEGIDPFTVILKDGAEPLAETKTYSQFNPNILPLLQLYEMEIQNSTGLTEFLLGLPTSKGRPTAREVMLKTAQSGAVLDSIAIRIENEILSELIYRLLALVIQNENPQKIITILGQEGAGHILPYLESEEKKLELIFILHEKIAIKVDGISQTLHRKEQIEQIVEFLGIATQSEMIARYVNFHYFLEKLTALYNFLSTSALRSEEEIAREEQERMKQIQEMQVRLMKMVLLALEDERYRSAMVELLKAKVPLEAIAQSVDALLESARQ